jgi:hypothetical protein
LPIDDLCALVRAEIEAGETLLVVPAVGALVELLVARGTPDRAAQARDVVAQFEALQPQKRNLQQKCSSARRRVVCLPLEEIS